MNDPIFENVPGTDPWTLSHATRISLEDNWLAYKPVRFLYRLLEQPEPSPLLDYLIESFVDEKSPASPAAKQEVKEKMDEVRRYLSGLMGSV